MIVHDDIIITGDTDEEHLKNIEAEIRRCNEYNIHLNLEKCRYFQTSVKVDIEGIHQTEEKIVAILEALQLTYVTGLKSILGVVTFYAKFIER